MKHKKNIYFLIITIAITTLLVAQTYNLSENLKDEPTKDEKLTTLFNEAKPVIIEQIKEKYINITKMLPASVVASEETKLSFRVGGPLIKVDVQLGEKVKKDQLLMQIDSRDFDKAIESVNAQKDASKARFDNAQKDFERISELFDDKVIPQSDFDKAKSNYLIAQSSLESINVSLKILKDKRSDTELLAPYDGVIISKSVENYEMIKSGDVVLTMQNINTLEIEVNIAENDMIKLDLKPDIKAYAKFPSLKDEKFEVVLKEWSTKADKFTKTYKIIFSMKNPDNYQILPGMTAEIEWEFKVYNNKIVTIPLSAISQGNDDKSFVWIFDKNNSLATKRDVTLGKVDGRSRVSILKGLKIGELIVTEGSKFISEKMKLTATKTSSLVNNLVAKELI